jgi:hypothetical protein
MSGFTIPNTPDAFNQNQAEPDSLDFQVLGKQNNGVVSGMTVTPGGAGTTIAVASGEVLINNSYYTYAGNASVPLSTFTSASFFDIVVARWTGSLVDIIVLPGNTGVNPRFPSTVNHVTDVVLASVWRNTNSTPSSNAITDKRVFVRSNTNRVGATATTEVGNHADLWVQPTTWTPSATLESPLSVKVNNTWYKLARYDASGNFSAGTITASSFVGPLTGNVNGTLDGYDTSQGETGNTIAVRDNNGGLVSTYVDANNPSYTSVFSTIVASHIGTSTINASSDVAGNNFYAVFGGSAGTPDFSWGAYSNYGMYLGSNLAIGFSINGTLRYIINSSGGANASSRRYKDDIQNAEITATDFLDIRLTSYIPTNSNERVVGVIAEELAEIESCRKFVIFDEYGQPDAVAYDRLAVAYIELLKDHEARLQALENAN